MTPTREEIQEVAKKMQPSIEKTASVKGWRLNENIDVADSVIEGLARNKLIHGKRYCPCRLVSGDDKRDHANICPCIYADEDIARDGHCHCYLFFK